MSEVYVKITKQNKDIEYELLSEYCQKLSKKNNSILYKLEEYLDKKMLSDDTLTEIRDCVLTVSADIRKLNNNIKFGDSHEGL